MMLRPATLGALCAVAYTLLISGADGITKALAAGMAAPQMYALSGGIVAALAFATARTRGPAALHVSDPGVMAWRAGLTVLACVAFFCAFRLLPLAELFVFIALMPLVAGILSGPLLGEPVRPQGWAALVTGLIGMLCLFPPGSASLGAGHAIALAACLSGNGSMVLARRLSRSGTGDLAQVFYPNLAICLGMTAFLPFVLRPMGAEALCLIVAYALFLFFARWVLVAALARLPAYVVTLLLNLQFVWMVLLGAVFFGEWPAANVYVGAGIVAGSGLYLLWDRLLPETQGRTARA